jgi:RNA polymerase sigma factor (sigma-70 family)
MASQAIIYKILDDKMINLLNSVIANSSIAFMEDEDLVASYLSSQNVSYFNLLYERYSRKVYAKCFSMLKDDMKAEDAMQDIFMKLLTKISSFGGRSKFSTWLYSMTYNFCIDQIRLKKRDVTSEVDDINKYGDNMADEVDDKQIFEIEVERLKEVLDSINEDDRVVLLMKYQDEMSIKEMGEILSKSESAMKMQIKRAKERCMKMYEQKYN